MATEIADNGPSVDSSRTDRVGKAKTRASDVPRRKRLELKSFELLYRWLCAEYVCFSLVC